MTAAIPGFHPGNGAHRTQYIGATAIGYQGRPLLLHPPTCSSRPKLSAISIHDPSQSHEASRRRAWKRPQNTSSHPVVATLFQDTMHTAAATISKMTSSALCETVCQLQTFAISPAVMIAYLDASASASPAGAAWPGTDKCTRPQACTASLAHRQRRNGSEEEGRRAWKASTMSDKLIASDTFQAKRPSTIDAASVALLAAQ